MRNAIHMSDKIRANIGIRLKEERERLEMSQATLAEVVGGSRRAVVAWESGGTVPGADALADLAVKGVDVFYVITGQREALNQAALSDQVVAKLRERGIEMNGGERQNEVQISPLGLMWLLNMRDQNQNLDQLRWGRPLLSSVADFKPKHLLGLNIQLVTLRPYEMPCPVLLVYLDRTPPGTLWRINPQSGAQGRFDLDGDSNTLPFLFPDTYAYVPIFQLAPDDLECLKSGETLHINASL